MREFDRRLVAAGGAGEELLLPDPRGTDRLQVSMPGS